MSTRDVPQQAISPALDEARRHRAGVRAASAELERAVAAAVDSAGVWPTNLNARVKALKDAFELHVAAAEHPDGVLSDSVTVDPRLVHRADLLRRDHADITEMLVALASSSSAAAQSTGSEVETDALRADALAILTRISQHRHLGADLVYQAYMVDIEAAD